MDIDKMQALVIEPLRNFAALLSGGEISGEDAGELLALLLDGVEKKMDED